MNEKVSGTKSTTVKLILITTAILSILSANIIFAFFFKPTFYNISTKEGKLITFLGSDLKPGLNVDQDSNYATLIGQVDSYSYIQGKNQFHITLKDQGLSILSFRITPPFIISPDITLSATLQNQTPETYQISLLGQQEWQEKFDKKPWIAIDFTTNTNNIDKILIDPNKQNKTIYFLNYVN